MSINFAMSVKNYSYFDNNATIPTFPSVTPLVDSVADCGNTSGLNPVAKYWQGKAAQFEEVIRSELAAPEKLYEIIWVSGSTEANNTVIEMFCVGHPGATIVTTKIEHKCLIAAADQAALLFGCNVYYVAPVADGTIAPDDVYAAVRHALSAHATAPLLVAIMHANNETGAINSIQKIARGVRRLAPDAFIYTDCAQTLGKIHVTLGDARDIPTDITGVKTSAGVIPVADPLDIYDYMGTSPIPVTTRRGDASVTVDCLIDGMCGSAHKTGGPFGIGILVLSRRFLAHKKFVPMAGGQNYGLRGGTYNMPGIIGFRESWLQMERNHEKATALSLSGKGVIFRRLRGAGVPIMKYTDYISLPAAGVRGGPSANVRGNQHTRPDKCFVYFETNDMNDTLPGTLLCSVVYNSCFMSVCNIKLRKRFEAAGIIVSVGSACNASGEGMSHVLKAMNCPKEVGVGVLRISSYMNPREDYEKVADTLTEIFGDLRGCCVMKK